MTRLVLGVSLVLLACGQTSPRPATTTGGAGGDGSLAGQGTAGAPGLGGAREEGGSGGTGGSTETGGAEGGDSLGGSGGDAAGSAGDGGTDGACPSSSTELSVWPGPSSVTTLEPADDFASDLSGLTYESPGVLWAVNNLSATLFRLVRTGASYARDTSNDWGAGKRLRFPDGQGMPDAEGVTLGATSAAGVYVSSERNSNASDVSRLSVLRYDASASGTALTATHEWDLTSLLPKVGPNAGLEAITWVSDTWLTAHGFEDESQGKPYAPSDYGEHGGGVFWVGVEQTGLVHGFALDHTTGGATLLARIASPLAGVMGLEMDRDSGELWAYCDDTCDNEAAVFAIAPGGKFELKRRFRAPSGLPNSNNEGIALAPDSECSGGFKPFFWTDDADQGGFSLRQGSLSCDCR